MEDYKNNPGYLSSHALKLSQQGMTERSSFFHRRDRRVPPDGVSYELVGKDDISISIRELVDAVRRASVGRNNLHILGYGIGENVHYKSSSRSNECLWIYNDPWNHRDRKADQLLIISDILKGLLGDDVSTLADLSPALSEVSRRAVRSSASPNDNIEWESSSSVSGGLDNGIGSAEPSQPSGGQDDDDAFLAFLEEAAGNVATEVDAPISAPEIELLGGAIAIGQSVVTPDDLVRAIESGFRPAVLDHLIENGFEKGEIERLVAPLRTQQRRRKEGRLSPSESDVTCRLARVLIRAEGTLGNRARAFSWLRRPNRSFADATPMTLLGTEAGGRRVEELLLRADFGMMA